jgi:hypothetical protein
LLLNLLAGIAFGEGGIVELPASADFIEAGPGGGPAAGIRSDRRDLAGQPGEPISENLGAYAPAQRLLPVENSPSTSPRRWRGSRWLRETQHCPETIIDVVDQDPR